MSYLTIARDVEAEIEVKRSRFLCTLVRVEDEAAARAVVERLRKQHWDAGHHCTAIRVGPLPGAVERSSDDGEPAGTAGAPMLDVLREHLLELDHADAGRVESELRTRGIVILDTEYGAQVTLRLGVPRDEEPRLGALLAELTGGTAETTVAGERWVDSLLP